MEKKKDQSEQLEKSKRSFYSKYGYHPQMNTGSKESTVKIRHSDVNMQQDLSPFPEMVAHTLQPKSKTIRDRGQQQKNQDKTPYHVGSLPNIDYPYETDSNHNSQTVQGFDATSRNCKEERKSEKQGLTKQKSVKLSFNNQQDMSAIFDPNGNHSSSNLLDALPLRGKSSLSPTPRAYYGIGNGTPMNRTNTVKKFQKAVQKAIDERRQRLGLDKKNSRNGASPSKKGRSLFDVVMNLKVFRFNRKKKSPSVTPNNKQQDQLNLSNRALLEPNSPAMIQQRKERAKKLWRKAKLVLRAIMTWKAIRSEIQLYGTHNYKYRQNFNIGRQTKVQKGQPINRQQTQREVKKQCRFSIHPESKFKKLWSIILMFLLIYVATIMPFNIAFITLDEASVWFVIDTVIDFAFMADIFVNFLSAYYDDEGNLVTENKTIAKKYLKTWFFVDLLASFPVNLIVRSFETKASQRGNYNQILRLLRLPRLYRLLKIARLVKLVSFSKRNPFFQRMQDFMAINAGVLKLLQFLMTGIICIHVAACFWFLASTLSQDQANTWIVSKNLQDASIGRQYLASLYWSITTILTVGYGDIVPGTNTERAICIIWMVIGVGFYSFTIGTLTSILSRIDTRSSQLKDKVEVIEIFCTEAKLDQSLQKKIKDVLEYNSLRNAFSWIEKYSIFNELPPNLKCEVAMQIHDGAIGKLPFFQGKDQTFIGNIVPLLQPLRVIQFDYIYKEEDHPYEVYFIVKGRVNFVITPDECVFKQWPQGSYFGEIEIILQRKRICTAKAGVDCDLFTLNKKFYQSIIQNDYPEVHKKLKDIAYEREKRIIEGSKKAEAVAEQIGVNDNNHIAKLSRIGSVTSAQTNKLLINALKNSSARRLNSNFRKFSDQMSAPSKVSQDNLQGENQPIKESREESKSNEDSEESSGSYNIWGNKNNHSSSEEDKKQEDSFVTDRSMGGKNLIDNPKDEEKKIGKSLFKPQRNSIKPLINQSPFEHAALNQQLPQVNESSRESGSIRKTPGKLYEDQELQDIEEFKMESREISQPRIQIIHEQTLSLHDSEKFSNKKATNNLLDVLSSHLQDSFHFSNQPSISKASLDARSPTRGLQKITENSSSLEMFNGIKQSIGEAPKILINNQQVNYNRSDSLPYSFIPQGTLKKQGTLAQRSPSHSRVRVESQVMSLEITPLRPMPSIPMLRLPIKDINGEVQNMKNQVKDIQKEMQSNRYSQTKLQEKVNKVTNSLNMFGELVKEICIRQEEYQQRLQDQEQRLKEQELNKFKLANKFNRPKALNLHSSTNLLKFQQQDDQSPSLMSGQSVIPSEKRRGSTEQMDNTSEHLKIARKPLNYDRVGGKQQFSYQEDLEHLQKNYGDVHQLSKQSIRER